MSSAAAQPSSAPGSSQAAARVADLFERHGRMVYGICRAMLRDVQEAEDATQQAFLSAYRALLGGARVRDSGAWIATIARNECRARISARMRAPLQVADDGLADVAQRPDEVEQQLQAGELRDALAELPERQREAVVLRYVYGLRYGEVAKALGLSRPATEALLFRARRSMRVRLRHAAGAALVVPITVREELALALPGFDAHAGSGAAAAGFAGGVLAKLVSAPAAAKIATATVAVSTVGAVGAVESDRPVREPAQARVVATAPATSAPMSTDDSDDEDRSGHGRGTSRGSDDDRAGEGREERESGESRHGGRGTDDDATMVEREGSSGPGSGEADADDRSGSGSSGRSGSGSDGDDDDSSDGSGASGSGENDASSGPGSGDDDPDDASSGSSRSGSGDGGPDEEPGDDEPDEDEPDEDA